MLKWCACILPWYWRSWGSCATVKLWLLWTGLPNGCPPAILLGFPNPPPLPVTWPLTFVPCARLFTCDAALFVFPCIGCNCNWNPRLAARLIGVCVLAPVVWLFTPTKPDVCSWEGCCEATETILWELAGLDMLIFWNASLSDWFLLVFSGVCEYASTWLWLLLTVWLRGWLPPVSCFRDTPVAACWLGLEALLCRTLNEVGLEPADWGE